MIYLDHAATTPTLPEALEAMMPYLTNRYGNASSVHLLGQQARMAVEEARDSIAACLKTSASEIVFTSGGTESDNAAIRGVAFARRDSGRHIITTGIEHEAVVEACRDLELHHGFEITYVPPNSEGIVSVDSIARAIREDTILVSVIYANNEIGTIQPIAGIGQLCRARQVVFHSDGVQACGVLDIGPIPADLFSLSAHKFGGPKGVGGLYVRQGVEWWPTQLGGGQERQRRSGTENVAAIVGMAAALTEAHRHMLISVERIRSMRNIMITALEARGGRINGSKLHRLPGNINVAFEGIGGESMVMALDNEGIMASTGAACSSGSIEPSHVLLALGQTPSEASEAIRLTLGSNTTWQEVETAGKIIDRTVARLLQTRGAKSLPIRGSHA